jgi:hypothetical protein
MPDDLAVTTLAHNDPRHRTWLLGLERGTMARRVLPATLFVHGKTDENVLYQEHPVALAEIRKSCGASYTFQTYAGIGHATYDLGDTAARAMGDFFQKVWAL